MFEDITVLYGPERERYTAYSVPLLEYNAFLVNNAIDTIPFHMLIDGYNVPSFVQMRAEFIIPKEIVNYSYVVVDSVDNVCDEITNRTYASNCIAEHVLFTPYTACDIPLGQVESNCAENDIPDELFTERRYEFLYSVWRSGISIDELIIDEGAHTVLDDNIFEHGVLLNEKYASYVDTNGYLSSYEPTNSDQTQREYDIFMESETLGKLVKDVEYRELGHNMVVDNQQYDEMMLDSERKDRYYER